MCPCDPLRGFVCSSHCQWQGCHRNGLLHTDHCIRGERVEPTDRNWYHDEEVPRARLRGELTRLTSEGVGND
jgi:hypothetical protein